MKQFELEIIPTTKEIDAVKIFTGDYLDKKTAEARAAINAFEYDVSTPKGRDAIKSFARKHSSFKERVDEAGKALNAERNRLNDAVNTARRKVKGDWESLRDDARQPLTEWEATEELKVEAERKAIELELDHIEALRLNDEVDRTREIERKEKEIAAKEESLRLAEVDRLAKIAAEEAEKARIKREEEIRIEAAAQAERDAQAEIDRAAREKQEEIDRLIEERRIAKDDAKQAEIDAAKEAERQKLLAEQEQERAIQAERDRIAAEKIAEQKAADNRATDKRIKARINNEAVAALILIFSDIHCGNQQEAESLAKSAVTAIARGHIPHVKISY